MPKKKIGTKNIVSLDQKGRKVKLSGFELENEVVFEFFNSRAVEQRDELLLRALYIGVLALAEDRLASFLSTTSNELGTQLESLKMIFEMKKEIFFKSAVKGAIAEQDIINFLKEHFEARGWKDEAVGTGDERGKLKGNKTGDVVCAVEGTDRTIVIEVKFDKSVKLGDIQGKDIFIRKADTAWSQILEAKANREAAVGMIVFDRSMVDAGISKAVGGTLGFIRGVGFVAIVDSMAGDFSNLAVAYALARDIVLHAKTIDADDAALTILVKRILKDLEGLLKMKKSVDKITKAAGELTEALDKGTLSMEFTLEYLERFLKEGSLNSEDLFAFYAGEDVKDRFKALKLDE